MISGRAWVKRNLGFDPIAVPAPANTFVTAAVAKGTATVEDYQREIIDFDSDGPAGAAFFAFTTATGMSRFEEIPWPADLAPKPDAKARKGQGGALPQADVLVVTWTVEEGHALSRVLTPGKDSRNDYVPYKHKFAAIAKKMRKGCPALKAGRLGSYWTTTIGEAKVVVFKSESHLSQDTKEPPRPNATLPNEDMWLQIIDEVNPSLVITTGTGGGIGKEWEVGDVVVSPIVCFDCLKWLKGEPFADATYQSAKIDTKYFTKAQSLFNANADRLPKDNTRPPKIALSHSAPDGVVTTDFFGFDTSDDHFKLQNKGHLSEMGDAVLGFVQAKRHESRPPWVAVRNVSDPQIEAKGTLKDQAYLAAQIYKGFGRWSSVCSAIVCWALIAARNGKKVI